MAHAETSDWLQSFAANWLNENNNGRALQGEHRLAVYTFMTSLTDLYEGDPQGPYPQGPSETLDVNWCQSIVNWLGCGTPTTVQALYDREQNGRKVHAPTIKKIIARINCGAQQDQRPGTPEEEVPGYQTPDDWKCPITLLRMNEPVVTPEGKHYERSAIESWLHGHTTDPMTRSPLNHADLVMDTDLTRVIHDWCEERESARQMVDKESDNEMQRLMKLVASTESRMNKSKEALNKVKSLKKRRAKLLAVIQTIDEELVIQTQIVEGCMEKVSGSSAEDL